jgi:hypothetical protein
MVSLEHRQEQTVDDVFKGLHLNPKVLDQEWVHGRLSLNRESKRSQSVRTHLEMCKICRVRAEEIREKDRSEDWKLAQLPEGDRD